MCKIGVKLRYFHIHSDKNELFTLMVVDLSNSLNRFSCITANDSKLVSNRLISTTGTRLVYIITKNFTLLTPDRRSRSGPSNDRVRSRVRMT